MFECLSSNILILDWKTDPIKFPSCLLSSSPCLGAKVFPIPDLRDEGIIRFNFE